MTRSRLRHVPTPVTVGGQVFIRCRCPWESGKHNQRADADREYAEHVEREERAARRRHGAPR